MLTHNSIYISILLRIGPLLFIRYGICNQEAQGDDQKRRNLQSLFSLFRNNPYPRPVSAVPEQSSITSDDYETDTQTIPMTIRSIIAASNRSDNYSPCIKKTQGEDGYGGLGDQGSRDAQSARAGLLAGV